MLTTIKRVFLSTVLLSSLLLLSLSNSILVFAENNSEVKPVTEETAKEKDVGNGSVAEPPSGPDVDIDTIEKGVVIDTPASVTGQKVQGTGTVTDFSTNGSKAFYTITDTEHNVFYLIVDLDKTDNNVYFLTDINKSDLAGSVDTEEKVAFAPPVEQETAKAENPKESGSNSFLLIVLLLAVIGVTAYYFLVMKKKQGQSNSDDEDEMTDTYDEEDSLEDVVDKKTEKDE
ncbi:CD1107 family mobile element protein [Lysinibacillus sp. NPDC096418]|uniref:CD1107 family mobile element protein n=1 Tax=Lysinibacillus sp. NPDC096418 TaxID=3364138 RepID=UPI0038018996